MKRRKNMATFLCGMAAVALVSVGTVPVQVYGQEQEAVEEKEKGVSSTIGDFRYSIDKTSRKATVTNYYGSSMNVIIPQTVTYNDVEYKVTEIGSSAFKEVLIETVQIPETVGVIGNGAFQNCARLKSITLPENLVEIGNLAFYNCTGLESVIIPKNAAVGYQSFAGCTGLVTVNMSGISLGNEAFKGCTSLTNLNLNNGLKTIGEAAFYRCTALENVSLPDSITTLGKNAFYECKKLATVNIPTGIAEIPNYTFYGCLALKSVAISGNVETIGEQAFKDCTSLKSVTLAEGVSVINSSAFSGCSTLEEVVIPDSVVTLGNYAFSNCSRLTSVMLPKDLFTIGQYAFSNCSSLTTVVWPTRLTTIDSGAFSGCTGLQEVVLPEGLNSVGSQIFSGCTALTSVTLPKTLNSIGMYMFGGLGFKGTVMVYKDTYGLTYAREKGFTYKILDLVFTLDIKEESIVVGQKLQLTAASDVADEPITWKSSDETIATVDEKGLVIGVAEGNATITVSCGGNVLQSDITVQKPADEESIRAFASRLYSLVLGRPGDSDGLAAWTALLATQESSGVDAGYGFVFSEECVGRGLSNGEFVEMLYLTFMNRASDPAGKEAWVTQLDGGVSREKIFEGFIMSDEFKEICRIYGIKVGNIENVPALEEGINQYRNQNPELTAFVARCYQKALGRDFDESGLESWCKVIIHGMNTPKEVAQNFIFSDEFVGYKYDNKTYVEILYRTFMGREADPAGLEAWVGILESGEEDRAKVLDGFSDSTEFGEILETFGLN